MLKSFKYRIYPTEEQKTLIDKHFGCVRFVYNLALETKQMAWAGNRVNLSRYDLQEQLKELKNDCQWLKEVNSQSLQVGLMNLDAAYLKFYNGQSEFPKYKSKSGTQYFNVPQNVCFKDGNITLPKFKEGIKAKIHRPIVGTIRHAVISKTCTFKYYISIICDTLEPVPLKNKISKDNTTGIDLGIKDFAITSDGEVIKNPKYLKRLESKLKFCQRKHSKNKGKRTKIKISLLHEKILNQRKDFLHKTSSKLINSHENIAIENLNIEGMRKNHNLAKSISDASWANFIYFLKYKGDWNGNNIISIGRFEPSSKMCSSCGAINKSLTLKDREWTCECGVKHNRDINAAINIKNFALKNHLSGVDRKNQNELPTLVGVLTSEAHKSISPNGNYNKKNTITMKTTTLERNRKFALAIGGEFHQQKIAKSWFSGIEILSEKKDVFDVDSLKFNTDYNWAFSLRRKLIEKGASITILNNGVVVYVDTHNKEPFYYADYGTELECLCVAFEWIIDEINKAK
jgi:putative transposase